MKVNFHNQTNEDVKEHIKVIKKAFRKIKNKNQMEIIFVRPETIKDLNKTYRNINEETDVLSFVNDEEESNSLGDVFISLNRAYEQAEKFGHTIKREIAFLAVHGYLHLIGYDHETKDEEKIMFAKQEEILNKAKITREWIVLNKIEEAKKAMEKAYVPYSKFKVGAALEMTDGTFIHGANIENASYPLGNCAERSALFSAYSQGYKKEDIKSITIIANSDKAISPCGACRQVMYELMPKDTKITLTNLEGDIKETTIDELLPYGFDLDHD